MIVAPVKTPKILPSSQTLIELLDKNLPTLAEKTIVAITSKAVSLCEGRIVNKDSVDKLELMKSESEYYYPARHNRFRHHFTIARHTILGAAGIDESNGGGYYVLLPKDVQKSANQAREHLMSKHGVKDLGVIITDSTSIPLRLGATGACLAYSGFAPINDYVGQEDLFGREFRLERANVAEGLAAAAVLAMGEGAERTPLCVITYNSLISFRRVNPSKEELESFFLSLDKDLFASFFDNGLWKKGGRKG